VPYDKPAIQYSVCQGVNEFVLQKTDGATDFPAVPSVNQDIRNGPQAPGPFYLMR